jgi:hypothetical protein
MVKDVFNRRTEKRTKERYVIKNIEANRDKINENKHKIIVKQIEIKLMRNKKKK